MVQKSSYKPSWGMSARMTSSESAANASLATSPSSSPHKASAASHGGSDLIFSQTVDHYFGQPLVGSMDGRCPSPSKRHMKVTLADTDAKCKVPGYCGHVPNMKGPDVLGLTYSPATKVATTKAYSAVDGETQFAQRSFEEPIVGYRGFVPNVKDATCGLNYRRGVSWARGQHRPQAGLGDSMNAAFTPSMRQSIEKSYETLQDKEKEVN